MWQLFFLVLFGVSSYLAAGPAWGDLPSLMSDKPVSAKASRLTPTDSRSDVRPERLLGLESPLKGKLSLYSEGDTVYRFSRSGIKASLKRGTATFDTTIGYSGERRLEMNWRAGGGTLKFAFGDDNRITGYRIEFTRSF